MTEASSSADPTPDSSHGVVKRGETDSFTPASPSQGPTHRAGGAEPETPQNRPPQDPLDNRYLQPSPTQGDEGALVGRDPRTVSTADLKALGHPSSIVKAVRAKCLDCAENAAEVRKCVQFSCPLWPMRMGNNPLHGKG